jgi:hypothetical protein
MKVFSSNQEFIVVSGHSKVPHIKGRVIPGRLLLLESISNGTWLGVCERLHRRKFFIWACFARLRSAKRKVVNPGEGHDLILATGTTLSDWAHVRRVVPRHHNDYCWGQQ